MSEFARLKNSEQFYKVKIEQQERQLHDLQMERQAMYQVIGAMVIEFEKTNACDGLTLDIESIGQNYSIHRVDSDQAPVVTYHAVVLEESPDK